MAAGKPALLTHRERRAVNRAVSDAESKTGLQICVYLGPAAEDTRAHAEGIFMDAGLHQRPSVLVLVAPDHQKVEIVTAPASRERITDEECGRIITEMTQYFARNQFVDGLLVGVGQLAEIAGPGTAEPGTPDLPNVVE